MIYYFRKEIKKWNNLWWVVLASLAAGSGLSFLYFRQTNKAAIKVASVNGAMISLKDFQNAYAELKSSIDDMARYWGIPADQLAKMMGAKDFATSALDQCINEASLDTIVEDFSVHVDTKSFQDTLAKTVSRAFIDASGKLNVAAYQNYLARLHMTISDYENRQEAKFKREAVTGLMLQCGYLPNYVEDELQDQASGKKSFDVLLLPLDHFVDQAKQTEVSEKEFEEFYKDNRENYRVGEKRKAIYLELTPDDYKDKVSIEEEQIERFYEKNKTSLYRIPPKVKVRTIVISVSQDASPDSVDSARKKAEKIYEQAKKDPGLFAKLAKEHSQDKESSANGGLIDFFQRGTYDPDFEKIAFLKLKNAGDLSEVVKTGRGFEVVRLEERISATEKPLADVRDDIVKNLVNRKTLFVLRGDLEAVVRTYRTDKEIFEKFAKSNKLDGKTTDWLTEKDAHGYEVIDMVARKLFAKDQAAGRKIGYFVHQGKHVLYKIIDTQKSFLPAYDKVKEQVRESWYARKAEKLQEKMVKNVKKELLVQKLSIKDAGEKHGLKVISTPLITNRDEVEELGEAAGLVKEAFALSDSAQVLPYKYESNEYLVRLAKFEASEKGEDGDLLADTEKRSRKQRHLQAFIASLRRLARIEIDEKMVKTGAHY